ncbi:serine protease inhibitor Kazal-type 8 isoform X1 [Mus caroli]|uniref:Serine protease inhibitor Kazal-type 8 isoform X1 n=1 Tax=Mus caroli TaxID=10089 RepID=A0A6P5QF23_MUSCR|nr:serine protease inhibitor Kazal-type 8 isoform X1 [Mus caroli]
MKVIFSAAALVLASSVWTSLAVDFVLPMNFHMTEELLQKTKALCIKNIQLCWILSYFKVSEPICGSNQVTYEGECHLCSGILNTPRMSLNTDKLLSSQRGTWSMTDSSKIPNLGDRVWSSMVVYTRVYEALGSVKREQYLEKNILIVEDTWIKFIDLFLQ